jgi:predicted DsbA family dithiol-disulfide isomerase
MYISRFGEARAKQIFARVAQAGADVGINFKFGGRTGYTRNSHRLVQLGKSKGAATQTRVVEAIMEAYFENEQDITSTEVLKAAGVKAGLDENEVAEWLAGDAGGREVDMEVRAAKMAGISGVPNFMVNGHYEIGGAQDPDVFLDLFEKIKAAEIP